MQLAALLSTGGSAAQALRPRQGQHRPEGSRIGRGEGCRGCSLGVDEPCVRGRCGGARHSCESPAADRVLVFGTRDALADLPHARKKPRRVRANANKSRSSGKRPRGERALRTSGSLGSDLPELTCAHAPRPQASDACSAWASVWQARTLDMLFSDHSRYVEDSTPKARPISGAVSSIGHGMRCGA